MQHAGLQDIDMFHWCDLLTVQLLHELVRADLIQVQASGGAGGCALRQPMGNTSQQRRNRLFWALPSINQTGPPVVRVQIHRIRSYVVYAVA